MDHSEIFKKYKISTITKYSMDYNQFNYLVRTYLPKLTSQIMRYHKFECVAEFEWGNDANHDVEITEFDLMSDFYHKYDKKELLDGEGCLGLHQIFTFLVDNKVLPLGTYEIRVSW